MTRKLVALKLFLTFNDSFYSRIVNKQSWSSFSLKGLGGLVVTGLPEVRDILGSIPASFIIRIIA